MTHISMMLLFVLDRAFIDLFWIPFKSLHTNLKLDYIYILANIFLFFWCGTWDVHSTIHPSHHITRAIYFNDIIYFHPPLLHYETCSRSLLIQVTKTRFAHCEVTQRIHLHIYSSYDQHATHSIASSYIFFPSTIWLWYQLLAHQS